MLINKILEYSAKKIKANPPLLYSTLNPETNSDSPSAKSKGVRFVSAKDVQNHTNPIGKHKIINQIFFWNKKKLKRLYPPIKKIKDNKINTNLTS
jgi:hypothetical protein